MDFTFMSICCAYWMQNGLYCFMFYTDVKGVQGAAKMTQHINCDYAVMALCFGLKFYMVTQLIILHNSADFYWNYLLFLSTIMDTTLSKHACKIWHKNFHALLSNYILGVASFLATPCSFTALQSFCAIGFTWWTVFSFWLFWQINIVICIQINYVKILYFRWCILIFRTSQNFVLFWQLISA